MLLLWLLLLLLLLLRVTVLGGSRWSLESWMCVSATSPNPCFALALALSLPLLWGAIHLTLAGANDTHSWV